MNLLSRIKSLCFWSVKAVGFLPFWVLLFTSLANASPSEKLRLSDVLSALDHHPKLKQAQAKKDQAAAKTLSLKSPYDLKLKGKLGAAPLGELVEQEALLGFSQQLPGWGRPSFFSRYEFGRDFAVYDGKKMTAELGRVVVGAEVNLWKDLLIDEDRAALQQNRQAELAVAADADAFRLHLAAAATSAYFAWLKAVQSVKIAERLFTVAKNRQSFLSKKVKAGTTRKLDLTDNQRLVLSREAELLKAQQKAEVWALKLSYYLRDGEGHLKIPTADTAKNCRSVAQPDSFNDDAVKTAIQKQRPELQRLSAEVNAWKTVENAGYNEAAPKVLFRVLGSQQAGASQAYDGEHKTKKDFRLQVGLEFQWDVQRRKGQGKVRVARAKQRNLQFEAHLMADQLFIEARSAHLRWSTQGRTYILALQALANARTLEDAERRSFSFGQSNLINVNLREKASAKVDKEVAAACLAGQEAEIQYRILLGLPVITSF